VPMIHVAQTESTNSDMLALAQSGAADGTWLHADMQSGGRGRLGRQWASPPGNLYASGLVRLCPSDPAPATLALVAGVALIETLAVYAPDAPLSIKWPNDILCDGAKLAGILLERTGDAVVIGIGANLAHHPDLADRPVTSLAAHGAAPDATAFCETLVEIFARWLSRWRGEGLDPVRRAWLAAAHPVGTALLANLGDGSHEQGLFDGLASDGALQLRLADGRMRIIHAGDVFLL
jgi:BirA family transcriptional regulator, biotin operon repressor / biotin---[acetyl-CoA-carboxylase] ligase